MNFKRTLKPSRLHFILLLCIIFSFVFITPAMALQTNNLANGTHVTRATVVSVFPGEIVWVVMTLVFSFLLYRFLHRRENKTERATGPLPFEIKKYLKKSNEIKPGMEALVLRKQAEGQSCLFNYPEHNFLLNIYNRQAIISIFLYLFEYSAQIVREC